jgi:hypothetical protein
MVISGEWWLAIFYLRTIIFSPEKKILLFLHIKDALTAAKNLDVPELLLRSYKGFNRYYQLEGNNDSTVKYQALIIKINDSFVQFKTSTGISKYRF